MFNKQVQMIHIQLGTQHALAAAIIIVTGITTRESSCVAVITLCHSICNEADGMCIRSLNNGRLRYKQKTYVTHLIIRLASAHISYSVFFGPAGKIIIKTNSTHGGTVREKQCHTSTD